MIDVTELTIWLEYACPLWYSYSNRIQLDTLDKKTYRTFFDWWFDMSDEIKEDFSNIIERKMDEYETK